MKFMLFAATIGGFAILTGAAQAQVVNDFDQASDTVGFVADRYQPSTAQSGVAGGGRNGVYAIGTDLSQGSNNRPLAFSSAFYNTIGMKTSVIPGQTEMSTELYTPDANWANGADDRHGGFWGFTGTVYTILEFARVAGVDQWRAWNNGLWINTGAAVNYNSWATLSFTLDTGADLVNYKVNGGSEVSVAAFGSAYFNEAYFQTHNTAPNGLNRTAHFDNYRTSNGAVPEPSTWALMILGFGSAGAMLRRRRLALA